MIINRSTILWRSKINKMMALLLRDTIFTKTLRRPRYKNQGLGTKFFILSIFFFMSFFFLAFKQAKFASRKPPQLNY